MIWLAVTLALFSPQEARYLHCESPEDIEFYAEIREQLPASFVRDWVAWNSECDWSTDRSWDDAVETIMPRVLKLVDLEANFARYAYGPEYER